MKKYLFFILITLFVIACGTSKKSTTITQTSTYKRDANLIRPLFTVFHINDSISELHFKINSKEILYTRPDGIDFYSNVLISYRLLSEMDSKEIIDSASVRLVDKNNDNSDKSLLGKINVKAKKGSTYVLRVSVTDLNRNAETNGVIVVEKQNDLNRQNFIVKSLQNNTPVFRNYLKPFEPIEIQYKAKMGVALYVHYYNRDFPLAAPPFSVTDPKPFQYKQDSLFVLQLNDDGKVSFSPSKKGFYHFQLDTTQKEGLTLFCFSDAFPDIKKAEDMVLPLRFITSKQEYDELEASSNKKNAIEKFWLNCTGSQERAKEIIRKYYNRIQDANYFFTSYLEGWKTDRGMIYLIYGSPNVIYRTLTSETWIYGEENNLNSLSYYFSKVNNPFTSNDYTLERSVVYKQSWYTAVDIWRQGRTYLQD
ncbi:MAG: GWxTD domain-containing protein [Bacteroidia bacterium]